MKKIISSAVALGILLTPGIASAHVVVTPAAAQAGERQLFTVSVPNERLDNATKLKLDIPAGVQEVSPTIAAGWTITTTESKGSITSITWSDGVIPADQRTDFTFSAVVPGRTGELDWKAYQTYSDGAVVSWNEVPNHKDDDNPRALSGPYSVTAINNAEDTSTRDSGYDLLTLCIAVCAAILSVLGFMRTVRR